MGALPELCSIILRENSQPSFKGCAQQGTLQLLREQNQMGKRSQGSGKRCWREWVTCLLGSAVQLVCGASAAGYETPHRTEKGITETTATHRQSCHSPGWTGQNKVPASPQIVAGPSPGRTTGILPGCFRADIVCEMGEHNNTKQTRKTRRGDGEQRMHIGRVFRWLTTEDQTLSFVFP